MHLFAVLVTLKDTLLCVSYGARARGDQLSLAYLMLVKRLEAGLTASLAPSKLKKTYAF